MSVKGGVQQAPLPSLLAFLSPPASFGKVFNPHTAPRLGAHVNYFRATWLRAESALCSSVSMGFSMDLWHPRKAFPAG